MREVAFSTGLNAHMRRLFPGLVIAVMIGLSASFLSEHYGAPAMLLAILIGLALHFLAEDQRMLAGLEFASKALLRLGIALLGLRVSVEMFESLGVPVLLTVIGGLFATIGLGVAAAPLIGRDRKFGLLTGGAVAICGASAAMAIAAVLGRQDREQAEREMVFVVIGVTMLSTLAMILYPVLAGYVGLDDRMSGVFFGATIHDVAQVAGAGFSLSPEAGETAVVVKLIRVTMLAPIVLAAALAFRGHASGMTRRPPLLPGFVFAFLVLAAFNSVFQLPAYVAGWAGDISRWALLIAIGAVGVKTSIPDVFRIGRKAMLLLIAETLFLGAICLTTILVI